MFKPITARMQKLILAIILSVANTGCSLAIRGVTFSTLTSALTSSPTDATSLTWSQTSPYNSTSFTATWAKATSANLANQKIQFYSGASCAATIGGQVTLGSNTVTQNNVTGTNGSTYTYKIISIMQDATTSTSACSSSMLIDTTAPTISITSAATWITNANKTAYPITGTCSDGGSGISGNVTVIFNDGTHVATASVTCAAFIAGTTVDTTMGSLNDGSANITITAQVYDAAQNSTTSASVTRSKDLTSPILTLTSGSSPSVVSSTNKTIYPVQGTCSDAASGISGNVVITMSDGTSSVSKSVSCAAFIAGTTIDTTTSVPSQFAVGTNNITIVATVSDLVSNSTTTSALTRSKDNTPAAPTVTAAEPVGIDTTPDLTISGLETGASVVLYSDACVTSVASGTSLGASLVLTSPALTKGQYHFYAQQTNLAALTSPCTVVPGDYELSGTPMVSVWQTAAPAQTITLPLRSGFSYNILVDWGDATAKSYITAYNSAGITHTYAASGAHTVTIMGTAQAWYFNGGGDNLKLYQVTELGDLNWTSFEHAFDGCTNLSTFAGGVTSAVTNMSYMFSSATNVTPNTSAWNTAAVTNMAGMFGWTTTANPDVSNWDTSAVTNMSQMFSTTAVANPTVTNWDVSHVTDFSGMFSGASAATPNTTAWITSAATNMNSMFSYSTLANPNTANWDVSQVTNMAGMFLAASAATPSTATWITSAVTDMQQMFFMAPLANPNTTNWDVSHVTTMNTMFGFTNNAAPNTATWDTSSVTNMYCLFCFAAVANPDVSNWDVSHVTNMSALFDDTPLANPDVSNWDTSAATNMASMFNNAQIATPNVANWDVSHVTSMQSMFRYAFLANPVVTNWNTSAVTNMASMFEGASAANPNVASWNVAAVTNMSNMFNGITTNPNVASWNVAAVTNMSFMFANTTTANPNLTAWNTSSVTSMAAMFANALSANPDTTNFNTTAVTTMWGMFANAASADPVMTNWNLANVTNFNAMFTGITVSTANYSSLLTQIQATSVKVGLHLDGGFSHINAGGIAAEAYMTGTYGWTFTDGGP